MADTVVRTAQSREFPELLAMLMAAFCENQLNHARFDHLMPETVRADQAVLDHWYIALHEGQIVASTQIVPQRLTVAPGVELRVGGIGQVSCRPEFRNKGMMSKVLGAAVERMTADRYDVSVLGGDRQRYRHYGFEVAGSARLLWLTDRRPIGKNPSEGARPMRFLGDSATEELIHKAQTLRPTHAVRTREETHLIQKRLNVSTWVLEDQGGFAYASLTGERIAEYGGDVKTFERLLVFLLARRGLSVLIPAADGSGELEKLMLEFAGNYDVHVEQMLRIFDLQQLLERYRPLLEKRLACWEGAITLKISDESSSVRVARASAKLDIAAATGPADLTLDRPTWAQALFGPFTPELPEVPCIRAFAMQAFPLPFIWPGLSHI